ncbi:MAG: 3-dehydroquinate synthase [Muribaculaceae bacterium]|nr:3-dehydroquinate synthase [Muribaculaceae bacterium]
MQNIIFTSLPGRELDRLVADMAPSGVFILVDSNTRRLVLPQLCARSSVAAAARIVEIPPGEEHKTLDTVSSVWGQLQGGGATRHSLMVNLGGGLVTDLGGYAAACFKRGMRFINIPTTLLGAVDAAVGGKTGVNFGGLKNEIGVFREADAVIVSTCYFGTLPVSELLSGYAEMIKHALLRGGDTLHRILEYDISRPDADMDALLPLLEESVEVKRGIVAADPTEKGLRKALNLGHTAGHAFEAMAIERGYHLPHGHAVAAGLIVALVLSHMKSGLDTAPLYALAEYLRSRYIMPRLSCDDYPRIMEFMRHDKKNHRIGDLRFTLLDAPGSPQIDVPVTEADITAALDITRDLLHLPMTAI